MMWFDRAVRRGVDQGVKRAVDNFLKSEDFDALVERAAWSALDDTVPRDRPLTRLGFLWALRLYFRRLGQSIPAATEMANSTLAEFLSDEGIKYGDAAYEWTRVGAEEVGYEYEVRHWERAA